MANPGVLGATTGGLGGLTNEMIVNIVMARFRESAEFHRRFMEKTRQWYNLYRCIFTGERPPFKNVVMLPMLMAACWSDVANKIAITLSGSRIIEMDAIAPEMGQSAKRAEALLNQQLLDAKVMEKMIDFLMSADVYGTAILQYGWKKQQCKYMQRQEAFGVQWDEPVTQTLFDGPDFKNIDILDWFPQPGKKDIDDMGHVCVRWWADLDDLLEDAYLAQEEGREPMFDPQALMMLHDKPPSSGVQDEANERHQLWRSYSEYQAVRQGKYKRPVELIDMVGLVPHEFAPDGVRLRVMTVANRQVALRNGPSPYPLMRKNFRVYSPLRDMHFHHGIGKIEPVATLAASGNKLVSNRLDLLDLALNPPTFVNDSTELDTQNLVLWPGRIIKAHGEVGESNIRPYQFDLQAYPMVVNELEAISRYIDSATGVQRDTIQGSLSGDRQTAREFLGRLEGARTRLGLEARLFERSVIEGLADDFRMLDRVNLSMPRAVSLIGSSALMDPDTGGPLPPETYQVGLQDITADHRIRAIGASQMLSKQMLRQDFITTMQAMQSNPMALQLTNWVAFFSKFWRAFEMDPREMMVQQVPRMNDMMAQQGMNPEELAGPQGDVLEQLSPTMLGEQDGAEMNPMSMMGAGLQQNIGQ
jgi:hypothetical protein